MTPAMLWNWFRVRVLRGQPVFKIIIHYSNGSVESFKAHEFSYDYDYAGRATYKWTSARNHRPLLLNNRNIVAIFQEDAF